MDCTFDGTVRIYTSILCAAADMQHLPCLLLGSDSGHHPLTDNMSITLHRATTCADLRVWECKSGGMGEAGSQVSDTSALALQWEPTDQKATWQEAVASTSVLRMAQIVIVGNTPLTAAANRFHHVGPS